MEQNIADLLKDAFQETDFEQLDFDEDTATEASADVSQSEPNMKDDNIHSESSGSESDFDSELANREGETKYCSENNVKFSEEQSMKTGSVLCGSWDDSNTGQNKTQSHNQQLSLRDDECTEDDFEKQTGIHQQADDVSDLETVLPTRACHDLETLRTSTETMSRLLSYQMLDQPENERSSSEEDRTEPKNTEEHSLDDDKLNQVSAIHSTSQDLPVELMDIQSEGDMKEFTEEDDEDHEREEEGLADYPSDLSQSDSGDSSEGHKGEEPNHMDTQPVACSYENLEEALPNYKSVTSREDKRVDHLNEIMYETTSGKSDDNVLFQMKQDSCRDDTSSNEIPNIGESSEFGISENFQPNSTSEFYRNAYDSDISSDGDDCEDQEEKPDLTSHTILKENNTALQEQVHTFTKDFSSDPDSIEREVREVVLSDYQEVLEICGVKDLSSIPAFSGAGKGESYGTNLTENRNGSESHPSDDCSTKAEHNSERLEVSDVGENINTLLPGTFWSSMEEGDLKFDEFDWDINGKDEICDEVLDDFLEELENDEEENERDWEKEKARIEAFNRYYEPVEGEENTGRSHKVTFSLEPECYLHYEEDTDSSEEDPDFSSVKQDQSYDDESLEFPQVSFTAEDISAYLMGDDNLKVDEYDYDHNGDQLYKADASKICKEEDDFLKMKMEIEQEMEREKIEALKYTQESKEEQHEVTNRTHKALFRLHQEFSQNEEDNDSSEQDSNTEDDTAKALKTEDQSDSDELCERRLYTGRHKVLKGLQRTDKQPRKETPKRNTCVVVLRSVLAVSLASAVGLLSYCWATDGLDWPN